MRQNFLPVTALPAWAKLNDVVFYDVRVENLPGKGYGLTSTANLNSEATFDAPIVLSIPQDLILSPTALDEYARSDKDFRELRAAASLTVPRQESMLFLLFQRTISSPDIDQSIGVKSPWTEYARMLPQYVPLPTTWTEAQREMLLGTSLEQLVSSKLVTLERQFDSLCDNVKDISWCQKHWLSSGLFTVHDWVLSDALYRSRCLEIPGAGECMLPCIDMANHSSSSNAFWDRSKNGDDIVLQLRPDHRVNIGEEVTISYGGVKSAAEMLFSYGFIDAQSSSTSELLLNLRPLADDPLGEAKLKAFSGVPSVRIFDDAETGLGWEAPFLYFMILNEEDGLKFMLTQQIDGTIGDLQTFYNGEDVSGKTASFKDIISSHPMVEIFNLRCVAILQDILQTQADRLYDSEDMARQLSKLPENDSIAEVAMRLRALETSLMGRIYQMLDGQKEKLLESPSVMEYLGITETGVTKGVSSNVNDNATGLPPTASMPSSNEDGPDFS